MEIKWTRIEDVFPIENRDIPASYVSLPEGNGMLVTCFESLVVWSIIADVGFFRGLDSPPFRDRQSSERTSSSSPPSSDVV